jgi:HAD superfamily hydrolase (TIGR01509 family)
VHKLLLHRTVLFDVDGTVAETEGLGHLPAFNAAFAEAGIPWDWSAQDYGELLKVTGGFERMLTYAKKVGFDSAFTAQGEQLFRKIHQRKNTLYAERLEGGDISPRKGFVELVQAISDHGGRWAVVTTTSASNWQALWQHAILRVAQLPEPALIICGEDVAKKKPDPEAYELALQRLRLDSSSCIAIEDSRNGLIAARGAGIRTIVVRSQFFGHQEFPEAELVVGELSELL